MKSCQKLESEKAALEFGEVVYILEAASSTPEEFIGVTGRAWWSLPEATSDAANNFVARFGSQKPARWTILVHTPISQKLEVDTYDMLEWSWTNAFLEDSECRQCQCGEWFHSEADDDSDLCNECL